MYWLHKNNRGVYWLVNSILCGVGFGVFQSSVWSGVIFGMLVFWGAVVYEVFINKHNRTK